jgi:hypothetical protein
MKKIFLCIFFIIMLFPISSGFSQKSDTPSALSVALTSGSPFVYKDSEGYTIVVGEVVNNNSLTAVSKVQIRVSFYSETGTVPLETVRGQTVLEVIPALGTSPYIIKSKTPNPDIASISLFLEAFSPSTQKSQDLVVKINDVLLDETLYVTGTLTNGGSPIKNTTVNLAFYDAFEPPRLLGVSSILIGDMKSNEQTSFNFNEKIDQRAVSFKIFAQSDVFSSNFLKQTIPLKLTKMVTITGVVPSDANGNKLAEINAGFPVNIKSDLFVRFLNDSRSNETSYRYYAQVKQSGEIPYVEFLGEFDGRFDGPGAKEASINWIPENPGVYFIEPFVWDINNNPISDKGPIVVIVVN